MDKNDKYNAITDTAEFIKHVQKLLVKSKNWIVLCDEKFERALSDAKDEVKAIVEDDDHFWKILEDDNLTWDSSEETREYLNYQNLNLFTRFFSQLPEKLYEVTDAGKFRLLKETAVQVLENLDNYKSVKEVEDINGYAVEMQFHCFKNAQDLLTAKMLHRLLPESIHEMRIKYNDMNVNIDYINNLLIELSGYKYDHISIGQDMMKRIRELETVE